MYAVQQVPVALVLFFMLYNIPGTYRCKPGLPVKTLKKLKYAVNSILLPSTG